MTKAKSASESLESDIGGRVQRAVSLPKFLDNRVNRALRRHRQFGGNRSRLVQLALEQKLRELETEPKTSQ
jgi:metal-responsive CopG/Arc/MetJ family transcriptional regulator